MSDKKQPADDIVDQSADPAEASSSSAAPARTSRRAKRQLYGKVAKRGVVWSYVREAGTELIAAPVGLILARLLTPFDFGIAASATFFLALAVRLTNFGFNLALARIKVLRPEHASSVFVVSIGAGATAYAILASSGPAVASFFRAPQLADIMPIAALGFVITPFATVPAALMTRDMRFRQTAMCDWIRGIAAAATSLAMALAGYGFWSLVYNQLVGDIVGTLAKIVLSGWRPSLRFSASAMKDLFSFGAGIFAKRLLDYGASHVDNLVVARTLGMSALGFYDKGFVTVRRILIRLNTGGPMVSFRVLSLISEEPERFSNAYRKVVLATSLISYPTLIGLAVLGPDLIPVLYGPRWQPTVVPFQILCLSGVFRVLTDYTGSAIQAMGRIWGQVGRQLIYTGLIVVLVAVFSFWGLPGAAFGVLVATLVMFLLMEALLIQLTPITSRTILEAQVPGALCGTAVGIAVWSARWLALNHAPSVAQWERLIIQVVAGSLAYLGFIKFNRFREVRRLVRETATELAPPLNLVVRLLA